MNSEWGSFTDRSGLALDHQALDHQAVEPMHVGFSIDPAQDGRVPDGRALIHNAVRCDTAPPSPPAVLWERIGSDGHDGFVFPWLSVRLAFSNPIRTSDVGPFDRRPWVSHTVHSFDTIRI